jgi:hypothetical protein
VCSCLELGENCDGAQSLTQGWYTIVGSRQLLSRTACACVCSFTCSGRGNDELGLPLVMSWMVAISDVQGNTFHCQTAAHTKKKSSYHPVSQAVD